MEPKNLQHPEDEQLQHQEVNAGASEEAQPHAETELPAPAETPVEETETATNEVVVEEKTEEEIPVKEEKQATTEEVTKNETLAEEAPIEDGKETLVVEIVDNKDLAEEIADHEILAEEIDDNETLVAEETEKEPESIEEIEKEYADLSFEQLIEKLQEVVNNENINHIKQRVSVLKASILNQIKQLKKEALDKFIEEGGNKEEFEYVPSEWEAKFNAALKVYKDNKARFLENLELVKQKNLEAKQQIIQGLKELVENETNLKILNDKFKEFQEKWREIGPVPQNESSNLWQHYHFYVEKFFDILRINKELRTLDLKKNLEQKIKLCEQAEELLLQDSIGKSFKALQHLHEEWREIGPVLEDKKEEVWERFKNASDQLNKRRRDYYDSLLEEQQNNYNAKVVICEQAEELVASEPKTLKENNTVSDKLTELLKVWKTLGPAPAKLNEEIWQRFKNSLDKFFTSKKEYLQQLKNEQLQNFNQKLTLAIQAEALALRNDWKKATDEIITLQNEWKQIGPTARKNSEIVWKRFRAACDKFFENKANYFSNSQTIEAENLQKKEELIKKIEEHVFTDDKNENMEAMKAYQREFMELGHVPRKEKDKIYAKFREVVNNRFQDLKMTMEDVKRSNFKSKIDTILNNPNADQILDKERRFLSNKLQQLKDDIALWENNLGFFANSKNADLLKAEFSKKIEAAKIEAKELEYKIKMMVHKN
ncbi:MAG: DUF349 domain-containing protein [Bacteroidetes bacterium]|nr:DUF349 domain-containing protein [Bacteroidota bacterium]MCL2301744.1 DUF349 domain-containing protein [Lentimicrobiaceae bacterium]